MRKIMDHLLAVQNVHFSAGRRSPAVLAEVAQRRAEVPPPILAHFDRLLARGKKGVAVVHSGVCTACHMRITTGKLANLSADTDICLCDNCGRYLYLPESENPALSATPSAPALPVKRAVREMAHHAT